MSGHFRILKKRKIFKCFQAFIEWKKNLKENNEVMSSGFKAYKGKDGKIYFKAYVFGYVGKMKHSN
jgi:hypothetical protein